MWSSDYKVTTCLRGNVAFHLNILIWLESVQSASHHTMFTPVWFCYYNIAACFPPSCLYSLLWLKFTQSLSLSVCGHLKQMATGKKAETTHPDYVNTSVPASNWMLMLWSEMLIVSCAICWNTGELHCGMENWKLVCRRCLSQQAPLIAAKVDRCSLRAGLWSSC